MNTVHVVVDMFFTGQKALSEWKVLPLMKA